MSCKARTLLLGLVALVLMGSVSAGTAYAEAGPFFYGREAGSEGVGEKLSESNPGEIQGEGGEQTLRSTIGGTAVEITAKSIQDKGIIYNNALQGQVKVLLTYRGPRLIKPALKECEVKIGSNNETKVEDHLAWKWNGAKKQLEEEKEQATWKPGIIFMTKPIAEGETKLPGGTFAVVTFSGGGCGVISGSFMVDGSLSAAVKPANLDEWSSELITVSPGWKQQSFWNGKSFIGAEPGLTIGENAATFAGESINKNKNKNKNGEKEKEKEKEKTEIAIFS
jgi:hypothetical protein